MVVSKKDVTVLFHKWIGTCDLARRVCVIALHTASGLAFFSCHKPASPIRASHGDDSITMHLRRYARVYACAVSAIQRKPVRARIAVAWTTRMYSTSPTENGIKNTFPSTSKPPSRTDAEIQNRGDTDEGMCALQS